MTQPQSLSTTLKIDAICDAFESAWELDQTVRAEQFVPEDLPFPQHCLGELLDLELSLRKSRRLSSSLVQFSYRLPREETILARLFADIPPSSKADPFTTSLSSLIRHTLNRVGDASHYRPLCETELLDELAARRPYYHAVWIAIMKRGIGDSTSAETDGVLINGEAVERVLAVVNQMCKMFSAKRSQILRHGLEGHNSTTVAKLNQVTTTTVYATFRDALDAIRFGI